MNRALDPLAAQLLLRAYARATNMLIAGRSFATDDPTLATLLRAFGAHVRPIAEAGVPSAPDAESGEAAVAATQVYELAVDKNFRRSGHASRLLSAVADLTSGQLRVWVGVDDEERQRFYTSAGFAPSGAVRVLGDGPTQHMWWAERD